MKRENLIKDLLREGFSEKTLVKFSDKQIMGLHERIIGEQVAATTKAGIEMPHVKSGSPDERTLKTQGRTFVAYESEMEEGKKLSKKQVDKIASKAEPKDKITKADFEALRKEKKDLEESKPSAGLSKKKKSEIVKKAKKGGDIGKKGKGFEKIEKKAKESGAKDPKAVAAAAMWKNIKRESVEVKNWVNDLTEKNYHNFASKGEIMNIINEKMETIKKGKGLPDFLKFDAIKSGEMSENKPTIAPPKTKPGTKPKTPYQPGPGKNPKPKAVQMSENKPKVAPPKTKPGTKTNSPYKVGPGKKPKPKA